MASTTSRFNSLAQRLLAVVVVVAACAIAWVVFDGTASVGARSQGVASIDLPQLAVVSLTGEVRSNAAQPIPAATICVYGTATAQLDRFCATTDVQGGYSLSLSPGRYSVTASAANHVSVTESLLVAESKSARLDFTLAQQGPTIAGVIRSAAGARIPAARIAVYNGDQLVSNITTNDKGEFTAWTPPGSLVINVDAEGFGATVVHTVAPTMDIVVILYPGNRVTGRVLLQGSLQPVPNVRVSAVSRVDRVVSQLHDAGVQTDERGQFVFPDLRAGLWTLTVSDRNLWGALPTPIVVTAGKEERDITLLVQPAAEVSGRFVVGENAQPCKVGRLHLTPEAMARQGELNSEGSIAERATTEDKPNIPVFTAMVEQDGAVRFDAIPYGEYRLGPICNEHKLVGGPATLAITGESKTNLQWKFDEGLGVTVRVVDETGHPVANAAVSLSLQSDQPLPRAQILLTQRSGTTDVDGKYRFGGLQAGKYQVSARYSAVNGNTVVSEIADLHSVDAAASITLTLPGKGAIRIYAHTPGGVSISRMLFFATDSAGMRYEGTYRGDGRFVIGPLPLDQYRVYGYDNKNAKRPLNGGAPIRIASAEPIDIDFSYDAPTARLEGRVTDANGAPLPGVLVRAVSVALDEDDEHFSMIQSIAHGSQELMTDQNGSFQVDGLNGQATYDLYVDHQSGLKDVRRGVSPGAFVDVALPTGATVTGTVISADGKPVANFDVLAYNREANDSRTQSFNNTSGTFRIENVHPGLLEIAIYSDDNGSSKRAITLAPGQTIEAGQFTLSGGDSQEPAD
jgi:uncharacterized GH25 family protein